ncbi:ADOP family duplicated permease [Silvibacterium sp.]|uniref:ABC transporter permease n=1 Tax=Silvibacterium sp. TaxID=1964179 RepID=UPI0039E4C97C
MNWFGGEKRKRDLEEELASHLAMASAERRAAGENVTDADTNARRELGNVGMVQEATRASWGGLRFERILRDMRYALRQIKRSPGFAASVIGTLALGIGAATAMFTVVDHVMLQSSPYKDPERLVAVRSASGEIQYGLLYPEITAWRQRAKSFESIGFSDGVGGRSFIETSGAATQVSVHGVSANLFSVLGVAPIMGPGLPSSPESFAKSDRDNDAVISFQAWQSVFHGDRNVIGKYARINGQSYVVVGVMPRGFSYPERTDSPAIWTPIVLGEKDRVFDNDSPQYQTVARLSPGATIDSAIAETEVLHAQVVKGLPRDNWQVHITQIHIERYSADIVDKDKSHALLALLGAAALLWLIACVNATNLLLVRASARQREIAMRGALGASRIRLLQQMVVEGLVLSSAASLLGAALAMTAVRVFQHAIKQSLPLSVPALPSVTVMVTLAGLTLLSAVLASVWPALIAVRAPMEPALRQGGLQGGTSRGQQRLRGGLVVAEIAMSLALLAACGLLLRTIYALRHVPLGFRTDHILVTSLDVPTYRYAKVDAATQLYEPLLDRVEHLPGVQAAGLMTVVPLDRTFDMQFGLYMDDTKTANKSNVIMAKFKAVSPDMQGVYGFQMLRGRYFNAQDTAASDPVMVVNRAFALAFLKQDPDIGKIIGKGIFSLNGSKSKQATIVGVLDDFHQASVGGASVPEIEVDLAQMTTKSGFYQVLEGITMDLAVRTQRDPSSMIPELRAVLKQASPELTESKITTMNQIVEDSYGSQMLAARLLEIFAGSALLLCAAGLYGLLAYVVSQRTREMGVRFALGASRSNVMSLVMRQAGVLVMTGVVLGLVLAWFAGKLVSSFLFGVQAHDGWTLSAVALTLTAAAAVAAWLPARRAASVNPVEALRAE